MPKQTGPRTAEGKAKSAKNAIRHGLTSSCMFVFRNETEHAWNAMLEHWIGALQPRNEAERMIVTDIAHAQWRLRRSRIYESELMNFEMEDQFDFMLERYDPPVSEYTRMGCAFKSVADKSRGFDVLHRYENQARRTVRHGLNTLEQMRRIAGASPAPAAEQAPDGTPKPETARKGPQPVLVPPAQKPAAQQLLPEPQKVQNEIRRERIRRIRINFGNRIPIRLIPPSRRKCR